MSLGIGLGIGNSSNGRRFMLPYPTSSFTLNLTNFEKRWNRDILFGYHSGNNIAQPVFQTDDGDVGFLPDYFQDGTPAGEGALRFLMIKENNYVGLRFGRTPRNNNGQEIHGPHLRNEVRSIMNLRLQCGNLILSLGGIIGNTDPYYYFLNSRTGSFARKVLSGMSPLSLAVAYGELYEPFRTPFDTGEQPTFIANGNRVPFSIIFPDRVSAHNHDSGVLTTSTSATTPSVNTGPSANSNREHYIFFESSSPSNDRLGSSRMAQAGRIIDVDFLRGTSKTLTMEVCLQGVGFSFVDSGLFVYEFNDGTTPTINGTGASHTHHMRGWPYAATRPAGQQVAGYGNNNNFTVARNGGWRTFTINIADDTTNLSLQPAWSNSATDAPNDIADVCIRSIQIQGNV